jgi:hypothetical protein
MVKSCRLAPPGDGKNRLEGARRSGGEIETSALDICYMICLVHLVIDFDAKF